MSDLMFPKTVALRDPKWLKAIRQYPCVLTGDCANDYMDIVPAHLSFSGRGISRKADDSCVLPLRADLHQIQHGQPEILFWRTYLTDELLKSALTAYARELHAQWRMG